MTKVCRFLMRGFTISVISLLLFAAHTNIFSGEKDSSHIGNESLQEHSVVMQEVDDESVRGSCCGPCQTTGDSGIGYLRQCICSIKDRLVAIEAFMRMLALEGSFTCVVNVDPIVSQIEDLECKLDDCCATTHAKLDMICCKSNPLPTDGTPITQGGFYKLADNISGFVVIDADDVHIDLCGFTLSGDAQNPVIEVVGGHEHIKITNGRIKGAGLNDGIVVNQNCQLVVLSELTICECDNGINFVGAADNFVKAADIRKCTFDECNKGVFLQYTKKSVCKDCSACNCRQVGFGQTYSEFNVYETCRALETANNVAGEQAVGFLSLGGSSNVYKECIAEGTQKTVVSDFGKGAIGFLLTGVLGDMEVGTKIINCIVNTTAVLPEDTSANALGINIEPVLLSGDDLLTLVASANHGDTTVHSVAWTWEGRYLATTGNVGGDVNNGIPVAQIRVYNFDGTSLHLLNSYSHAASGEVYGAHWSPDGKYLAIGGNQGDDLGIGDAYPQVRVYSFNGSALTLLDSKSHGMFTTIYSVNWSPDGNYLAIGGSQGNDQGIGDSSPEIRVYSFDGSTLTLVESKNHGEGATIRAVNWSSDGKYLAIGGTEGDNLGVGDAAPEVRIYSFDGRALTLLDSKEHGSGVEVFTVQLSPDGRYLAIGGQVGSTLGVGEADPSLRVYRFDGTSLTLLDSKSTNLSLVFGLHWSPCGHYLAVGDTASTNGILIYSFNGASLTFIDSVFYGGFVSSVDWSPTAKYISVGGGGPSGGDEIKVYSAMDATSKCLIDGNRVCETGNGVLNGIGIAASGENMYVRNVLYANDAHLNRGVTPRFGNIFGPAFAGTAGIWDSLMISY